jgi:hypothetical protein
LAGVRAGRAIEPRNAEDRGAHALLKAEGNTAGSVTRELSGGPARSENQGMCGTFVCENREVPCLPVRVVCGRAARGTRCGNPWMYGCGKSDQFVVPASLPNEARAEEAGEERN